MFSGFSIRGPGGRGLQRKPSALCTRVLPTVGPERDSELERGKVCKVEVGTLT